MPGPGAKIKISRRVRAELPSNSGRAGVSGTTAIIMKMTMISGQFVDSIHHLSYPSCNRAGHCNAVSGRLDSGNASQRGERSLLGRQGYGNAVQENGVPTNVPPLILVFNSSARLPVAPRMQNHAAGTAASED